MRQPEGRVAEAPGMVTTTLSPDLEIALSRLKPRPKTFVLEYFNSWDGRRYHITNAAIKAGYSPKTAYSIGSELLKKPEIALCVKIFMDEKVADSVSTLLERKQTLTEMHRGRMHHFGTAGADGFIPDVGPENLNSAALAQIETRVEVDKAGTGDGKKDANGVDVAYITKLKLESKTQAIDLLNKMEGVYAAAEPQSGVSGMTINFNIISRGQIDRPAIDVPSEIVTSPRLKKAFALAIGKKGPA